MEDSEKKEKELRFDGQVLENNLLDAKVERQREEDLPTAELAEGQSPSGTRLEPSSKVPEGQPHSDENSVEDQKLSDDEQVAVEFPRKEAHQQEEEGLMNEVAEPDHNTTAATAVVVGDAGLNKGPENKDLGPFTPNSLVKCSNARDEDGRMETYKNGLNESKVPPKN